LILLDQAADIPPAMQHVHYQHIIILHAIDDDVVVHRKTAQARPQIIAATAYVWVCSNYLKAVGYGINSVSASSVRPVSLAM